MDSEGHQISASEKRQEDTSGARKAPAKKPGRIKSLFRVHEEGGVAATWPSPSDSTLGRAL